MLVKIRYSKDKWFLMDNCEKIEYSEQPRVFKTELEAQDFETHLQNTFPGEVYSIHDENADPPKKIGMLSFVRDQKLYLVTFSTICYLCSDSGKTVEKVAVNHDR